MFVDLPATSHMGYSSEVSSSHSHRRREPQGNARTGLSRGILDQVRHDFNKSKREQGGSRFFEMETTLLRNPVAPEIIEQQYPIDLRIPGSKDYSGKTDPEKHINFYYGNMLMMGVSDAVMCRAFNSTLSGRVAD